MMVAMLQLYDSLHQAQIKKLPLTKIPSTQDDYGA